MRAKHVYESISFERGRDPKDALDIGNKKARAKNQIREFAEETGWEYAETPRGVQILTIPLKIEVNHNLSSAGGYLGSFIADHLRYKISWVEDWEHIPLSLRKVYMRDGKETKQNLMGRMENASEVIKRIKSSYKKELKKVGISESAEFKRAEDPKRTLELGPDGEILNAGYYRINQSSRPQKLTDNETVLLLNNWKEQISDDYIFLVKDRDGDHIIMLPEDLVGKSFIYKGGIYRIPS